MTSFDVVIRGGTVVDGSGEPGRRADVGIVGDTILEVGTDLSAGRREIDASGRVVAPGFVDGHTHLDAQIFWDPYATSASAHGVTSAVMGNCGFTLAPSSVEEADLVFRSIERAEDMDRGTLIAGVPWEWTSFEDYLDAVQRTTKVLNVGANVGHCAVRSHVMGERAFTEQATAADLAAMTLEVQRALTAGALGLSSTRSGNHMTMSGQPVASRMASWEELGSLARAATDVGGVVQLALDNDEDSYERLQALQADVAGRIAFTFGSPAREPDAWRAMLRVLDASAAGPGELTALVHCREFQSVLGFRTSTPFDTLPGWTELRRRPLVEQRRALEDPHVRAGLVAEAMTGPYADGRGTEVRAPDFERLCVLDGPLEGRPTVADLARERATTPVDVIIDLALASDFDQLFVQAFANVGLEGVLEVMRHPATLVAQSDTGAHVSQLIDSSIPTYLLAYWVRQRQAFTLEEGIRMLTSAPARTWQLSRRGELVPGFFADVVVLDPDVVAPAMPTVAHDLPGNGSRLVQPAVGLDAVLCNGVVTVVDDELTGETPGRLLRRA